MVLGGHGDTMVPAAALLHRGRHPGHGAHLAEDAVDAMVERTRNGGAEIVKLLKTGSAYYAPAAAAVEMVEAILEDTGRDPPVRQLPRRRVRHQGHLRRRARGARGPGRREGGEIELSDAEREALKKSAEHVRSTIADLKKL